MSNSKVKSWWWLRPEHSKSRCSARTLEGDRCQLLARASGLCGLHAEQQGGTAAANIHGWSRTKLEKEVLHLRGRVNELLEKIERLEQQHTDYQTNVTACLTMKGPNG